MTVAQKIVEELSNNARPDSIAGQKKFFQAYPGGYGEGDEFISVTVPAQRLIAKTYSKKCGLNDATILLNSKIHEHRLTALMLLVYKYQQTKTEQEKKNIADFYLKNLKHINNWDLVDCSAHHILGDYYFDKTTNPFEELADSGDLWKQRVAVISTFSFIRKGKYDTTLNLALKLIDHKHDLIHKAVGWMLREVGNRAFEIEFAFIDKYCTRMPRTMLRYAIEKFPEEIRLEILKRKS